MRKLSILIVLVALVGLVAGCVGGAVVKQTPTIGLADQWKIYTAITNAVTRLGENKILTVEQVMEYREYRKKARAALEAADAVLAAGDMVAFGPSKASAIQALVILNDYATKMGAQTGGE